MSARRERDHGVKTQRFIGPARTRNFHQLRQPQRRTKLSEARENTQSASGERRRSVVSERRRAPMLLPVLPDILLMRAGNTERGNEPLDQHRSQS